MWRSISAVKDRAEAVAEGVRAFGRKALPVQADLTHEAETDAMMKDIAEQFGKLDLLALNASGGLEANKPADYAWQLNVTAQIRTMELALPLMPMDTRIVFVTSHPAHFYGTMEELPYYEPVATGKHAGEQALLRVFRNGRSAAFRSLLPRFLPWKAVRRYWWENRYDLQGHCC